MGGRLGYGVANGKNVASGKEEIKITIKQIKRRTTMRMHNVCSIGFDIRCGIQSGYKDSIGIGVSEKLNTISELVHSGYVLGLSEQCSNNLGYG